MKPRDYFLTATEAEWQDYVVEHAQLHGWWVWHDNDSRRNKAGLPDLLLLRRGECVWAELKAEKGRLSAAQVIVINELTNAGQEVHVWRPSDIVEVVTRLRKR